MSTKDSTSEAPLATSIDTLTIQWQAAMERIKHFEALTVTGLGLYLAALAYAYREVLAQNPTEQDYWGVVFVLTVLCISLVHGVDRVNDSGSGLIEIEAASEGRLTYFSKLAGRVTWTASFGFVAIFVAPVFSVLYITFAYRNLASKPYQPLVALAVSSLIFLLFAFGILHEQRRVVGKLKEKKSNGDEPTPRQHPPNPYEAPGCQGQDVS